MKSTYDKLTSQQALIPMMGKITKELRAIMTQEFRQQGIDLTKEQAIVLRLLLESDGQPQNDLALITARDKTSLTRLLSTMEKKGLINRKPSTLDKRVNLIFITKEGKRLISKAEPIMLNLLDLATKGLDEKQIESTKQLLQNIYQNITRTHE